MKGELTNHLNLISELCEERLNILMNNYVKNDEKLSEKNKKFNQLEWVKLMSNYKNCAEEVIFKELIYVQRVSTLCIFGISQHCKFTPATCEIMGIIPNPKKKEDDRYKSKKYKAKCFS